MPAKPKIPPAWKPCIKAIMVGSHGAITREMMVTYLGNYLGVQISESRIRQIMYDYEKVWDPVTKTGKVQKVPTQRKGSDND